MDRRRFLTLLGVGGAATAGVAAGHVATAIPSQAAQDRFKEAGAYAGGGRGALHVVWSVDTDEPVVALTFDDGPHPELTPRVLDALAAAGASATFFAIGQAIEREPALAKRVIESGHELANHGWAHESLALLDEAGCREEVERGAEAVAAIAGARPAWYRPPRGMVTGTALRAVATAGASVAMWSVDRGPADDGDDVAVAQHLIGALAPGAIVDLHDGLGAPGRDRTSAVVGNLAERRAAELRALPTVLEAGRQRGVRFVTLSALARLVGRP